MTRRFLSTLSRLLIGALLFGQLAVAAYACPGLTAPINVRMSSVPSSGDEVWDTAITQAGERSGDCGGMNGSMDPAAPNLCAEHCRYGQQSDQSPIVSVPVVLLSTRYIAPPVPALSLPAHASATAALAVASPPHAILHCCFRI